MLMLGSFWVSSLPGVMSGGRFSTLLDGVRLLFSVRPHSFSAFSLVGASLLTVPSKRIMTLGFWPGCQFARTYESENTRRNVCWSSSHWRV